MKCNGKCNGHIIGMHSKSREYMIPLLVISNIKAMIDKIKGILFMFKDDSKYI